MIEMLLGMSLSDLTEFAKSPDRVKQRYDFDGTYMWLIFDWDMSKKCLRCDWDITERFNFSKMWVTERISG